MPFVNDSSAALIEGASVLDPPDAPPITATGCEKSVAKPRRPTRRATKKKHAQQEVVATPSAAGGCPAENADSVVQGECVESSGPIHQCRAGDVNEKTSSSTSDGNLVPTLLGPEPQGEGDPSRVAPGVNKIVPHPKSRRISRAQKNFVRELNERPLDYKHITGIADTVLSAGSASEDAADGESVVTSSLDALTAVDRARVRYAQAMEIATPCVVPTIGTFDNPVQAILAEQVAGVEQVLVQGESDELEERLKRLKDTRRETVAAIVEFVNPPNPVRALGMPPTPAVPLSVEEVSDIADAVVRMLEPTAEPCGGGSDDSGDGVPDGMTELPSSNASIVGLTNPRHAYNQPPEEPPAWHDDLGRTAAIAGGVISETVSEALSNVANSTSDVYNYFTYHLGNFIAPRQSPLALLAERMADPANFERQLKLKRPDPLLSVDRALGQCYVLAPVAPDVDFELYEESNRCFLCKYAICQCCRLSDNSFYGFVYLYLKSQVYHRGGLMNYEVGCSLNLCGRFFKLAHYARGSTDADVVGTMIQTWRSNRIVDHSRVVEVRAALIRIRDDFELWGNGVHQNNYSRIWAMLTRNDRQTYYDYVAQGAHIRTLLADWDRLFRLIAKVKVKTFHCRGNASSRTAGDVAYVKRVIQVTLKEEVKDDVEILKILPLVEHAVWMPTASDVAFPEVVGVLRRI